MSDKPNVASDGGYRHVLRLAGPMILSTSSMSIMRFMDRMFVAWYSQDSLAAAVPAGIANFVPLSFFIGTAGYVVPSELAYLALSRTVTDESGRFVIHVARESRESFAIEHPGVSVDLSQFSLGIEAPDGSHRLVTGLRMSDGETSRSVNIRLP